MVVDILKRATVGVACGGFLTFVALTILMVLEIESSVSEIWSHMLASMTFGVYYGLASFIFEKPKWTPLKKTIVHFSLSIMVYFIIALTVSWIPLNLFAILISSGVFILIYSVFWTGYYLYFKKIEAEMNEQLHKQE
ncbi:DUF3021 domain-containing protein [Ornithinibacillus scapharcae]|uniref:DUF3021 domain-containing protein n=1 Tax=Ornithinibacillus scapharcae TaxID=1147159 RepID=UPI000225B2BB|nr:DUF3021 domain-containing protein [Ornithinibacillus scapharcae]